MRKAKKRQHRSYVVRWAAIRAFLGIMSLAVKALSKGAGLLPRPLERAIEPAMGTVNAILPFKRLSRTEVSVYLLVVLRLGTCMHHGQALDILHISSPSKPMASELCRKHTTCTRAEQDVIE